MCTRTRTFAFTLRSARCHFNIQNMSNFWLWGTIPSPSLLTLLLYIYTNTHLSHEPLSQCTDAIQVSGCHSNGSPCPSVLLLNCFKSPDIRKQTQKRNTVTVIHESTAQAISHQTLCSMNHSHMEPPLLSRNGQNNGKYRKI